ncbi:MAG: hypothetical protein OET87_09075, partial [Desulfobulbaceae bacterium]|nr:hypothetical protein [Desulfobulbaceae bacterium]
MNYHLQNHLLQRLLTKIFSLKEWQHGNYFLLGITRNLYLFYIRVPRRQSVFQGLAKALVRQYVFQV